MKKAMTYSDTFPICKEYMDETRLTNSGKVAALALSQLAAMQGGKVDENGYQDVVASIFTMQFVLFEHQETKYTIESMLIGVKELMKAGFVSEFEVSKRKWPEPIKFYNPPELAKYQVDRSAIIDIGNMIDVEKLEMIVLYARLSAAIQQQNTDIAFFDEKNGFDGLLYKSEHQLGWLKDLDLISYQKIQCPSPDGNFFYPAILISLEPEADYKEYLISQDFDELESAELINRMLRHETKPIKVNSALMRYRNILAGDDLYNEEEMENIYETLLEWNLQNRREAKRNGFKDFKCRDLSCFSTYDFYDAARARNSIRRIK